ncbi:MAG: hypothetical protein CMJ54_01300 [Planctomycetaceae bacterium]|nr:hypothetical protein [Planctomycetaceae bacterium]
MNFLGQPGWWKRFILGAIWVPIGAEIFLRLLSPVPMLPRYIEAGPHGVRANMPNQTYRHQTPEYTVELRTNSKGMRADVDFPMKKPENTRRIAVLGDSFAMGYGVNLEETSLSILESMLESELHCEVEILNFAVSGFGPAEQLVVLEAETMQYEPDLVIQYFTSTDLVDDVRSGLFRLENGEPVRDGDTYLPAVEIREFLFSFAAYRWLAGESHLYNIVRDSAGTKAKAIIAMARSWKPANQEVVSDAKASPTAPSDDTSKGELTLAILKRMRDVTESSGAKFEVLSVPVRSNRSKFVERFPGDADVHPFITPLPLFEQADGKMLYWERSHGHWTPLGCRLVAETLAEEILRRGLLGAPCKGLTP